MAFPNDWHRGVLADFLDAIEQSASRRASGEEALKVHRLIDALLAAGNSDGKIAVVQIGQPLAHFISTMMTCVGVCPTFSPICVCASE